MMKLLYKPTRNIFTLPDAEAMRIKAEDRGNDYQILDAGLTEEETTTVTEEDIAKLEQEKKDKAEALEAKDKEEAQKEAEKEAQKNAPKKRSPRRKTHVVDYNTMSKSEMDAIAYKLGINDAVNIKKEVLREKIREITGE